MKRWIIALCFALFMPLCSLAECRVRSLPLTTRYYNKYCILKRGMHMKQRFLSLLILLIALTGSACASALYDDYEPIHLPATSIPSEISLPKWTTNPSDEQLSAYVQALASSDFIKADLSDAE